MLNTARGYQDNEQDEEVSGNPNDIIMIDNPSEVTQLSEFLLVLNHLSKYSLTKRNYCIGWAHTFDR
jgi:hypothetical protein